MKKDYTCPVCDKEFQRNEFHCTNDKPCCSKECVKIFKTTKVKEYICKCCHKPFLSNVKRSFCSRECYQNGVKLIERKYSPSTKVDCICPICGKSFQISKCVFNRLRQSKPCCSMECRDKLRINQRKVYLCEYCGKPFNRRTDNKRKRKHLYCSPECARQKRIDESTKVEKECPNCHKHFFIKFYDSLRRVDNPFCSRKCQSEASRPEIECPICHKIFRRLNCKLLPNEKDNNYCSRECRDIAKQTIKVIDCICPVCKKPFQRKEIYITNEHPCCSQSCGSFYYANFIMKPEDHNWYVHGKGRKIGRNRGKEWDKLVLTIYERDNNICQECGKVCLAGTLHNKKYFGQDIRQCHHIIPYKLTHDNSPENLQTLCNSCHGRKEAGIQGRDKSTNNRYKNKEFDRELI